MQQLLTVLSLVLTTTFGGHFVFQHWAEREQPTCGYLSAVVFVIAMVAVHLIGYLALARQAVTLNPTEEPASCDMAITTGDTSRAIKVAAVQHAIVLGISFLILDGGGVFRACLIGVIVHWLCIAFVLYRPPQLRTSLDLAVLRYAAIPLCIFAAVAVIVRRGW